MTRCLECSDQTWPSTGRFPESWQFVTIQPVINCDRNSHFRHRKNSSYSNESLPPQGKKTTRLRTTYCKKSCSFPRTRGAPQYKPENCPDLADFEIVVVSRHPYSENVRFSQGPRLVDSPCSCIISPWTRSRNCNARTFVADTLRVRSF